VEQNASGNSTVAQYGWDFNTISQGQTHRYFIDITETSSASITANWLRNITITSNGTDPLTLTPSLANIDLRLFTASGFTPGALLDESVSPIDNVEHIRLPSLAPGRYMIEVSSSSPVENYTVSWDFRLAGAAVPEPTTWALFGLLAGAGVVCAHRRMARRSPAAEAQTEGSGVGGGDDTQNEVPVQG
jgi:hypothetical protein